MSINESKTYQNAGNEPIAVAVGPVLDELSYLERLSGIEPIASIPVEEKPEPTPVPAQKNIKKVKYCHCCGWDMDIDQEFCENCGKTGKTLIERLSGIEPIASVCAETNTVPAVAAPVLVSVTPVPYEPQKLHCIKCGEPMFIPSVNGAVVITCSKCSSSFIYNSNNS